MKQKHFLLALLFIQSIGLMAQVGINTVTPTATLEVNGNVLVQQKLYLEEPGDYDGSSNSNLMVLRDFDAAIVKYDIGASTFGPLNQVRYIFQNVNTNGLTGGYNTKIDANKYTLAVHGFSYVAAGGDTNVSLRSTSNNNQRLVEGQQFYAGIVTTGTGSSQTRIWWLYGFVNNSRFRLNNETQVDISMDVMIYRNEFITKIFSTVQSVDMNNQTTKSIPTPAGF